MSHKNIQYLTKFGPIKCPECKNSMNNRGKDFDYFECDNCNTTICYNSLSIKQEFYSSCDEFKFHYCVERWFDNCGYQISIYVNYVEGKSKFWITDMNDGDRIVLDTNFESNNMTFIQIYKHTMKIYNRIKKIKAFL